MTGFLLAQSVIERESRRLELARMPSGWWAVLGLLVTAGLVYAGVWLYRHEGRGTASLRLRSGLAGLRLVVVLGLLAIWLEPVIAVYLHRVTPAETLVLVDSSASMGLVDRYADAEEGDRVSASGP